MCHTCFGAAVLPAKLRSLLVTTPRSQRRWLATFRLRWGCASESSSCAATYQCKRSNPRSIWGKPVFGCVWESQNWGAYPGNNSISKYNPIATHFWECLALPFWLCISWPGFGLFPMDQRSLRSRSCPSPAFADQHGRDCRGAACQWLVGTVVKTLGLTGAFGEVSCLSDRRSHITFLASICHDPEVQLRLPQVLIGNEHQFSVALLKSLTSLPTNIHVWRCKSAWNTHALMRRYLSLLASSLGSVVKERYVILILDVARCHIHPTILAHRQALWNPTVLHSGTDDCRVATVRHAFVCEVQGSF